MYRISRFIFQNDCINEHIPTEMYSTPIAITIKPMILDTAFIPEAPSVVTMYFEDLNNKKIHKQTAVIASTDKKT